MAEKTCALGTCSAGILLIVQIAIELQDVKLEGIDKDDPMFGDWARVSEDEWTDFRKQ